MTIRKSKDDGTKIPPHEIEALARCLLPDIIAFYQSDYGQQEFSKWKAKQNKIKTIRRDYITNDTKR